MTITYCEPLHGVKPLDAIMRHNKGKLFAHIIPQVYINKMSKFSCIYSSIDFHTMFFSESDRRSGLGHPKKPKPDDQGSNICYKLLFSVDNNYM